MDRQFRQVVFNSIHTAHTFNGQQQTQSRIEIEKWRICNEFPTLRLSAVDSVSIQRTEQITTRRKMIFCAIRMPHSIVHCKRWCWSIKKSARERKKKNRVWLWYASVRMSGLLLLLIHRAFPLWQTHTHTPHHTTICPSASEIKSKIYAIYITITILIITCYSIDIEKSREPLYFQSMSITFFAASRKIVFGYEKKKHTNGRETQNPHFIWVSEILLCRKYTR